MRMSTLAVALLVLQLGMAAGEEGDGAVEVLPDTTLEYKPMEAGSVIDLSAETVKQAMAAHKFLLVEFYAPWCGHCKTLEPEYKKAAEELMDLDADLRIAKVDVTRNPSVQPDYGVSGFPTLKWFVNGKLSRLSVDARTSDGLVAFCKKNTDGGPVASTERLKAHLDQYAFVAVAYVEEEDSDHFEALSETEGDMMHLEFVYITSPSIATEMKAKVPSIVFYTREKESTAEEVYDGPLTGEEVTYAVRRLSTETIKMLNDENSDELIFEDSTPKVVLFRSQGEISGEFIALKGAAEALKHKFNFYVVGEDSNERLTRFVGLETESSPPQAWIYVFQVNKNKRYRYEGEMHMSGLSSWLTAYEQDEISPYLMSETPKEDDGSIVKTVVGTTFREFKELDKHVVVEFYAPWCGHCRSLEPRYKLTAEYLELKFPGEFAFGKIDGTKNEVGDDNQIQGFPTVWLFPKGKKGPPFPIDLSKESSDIHLFVKSLRLACEKPKEERAKEPEYVAAAKRFKAAVRALEGTMAPAVKELNEASARLEKIAAKKSEL